MTNRHNDWSRVREYAIDDHPPAGYEKRIDGRALLRGGQPQSEPGEDARRRSGTFAMLLRKVGFQTR